MNVRRALLGILSAALVAACSATHAPRVSLEGVPAEQMPRAQSNLEVFDVAWSTVADEYYDRELHGVDWEAAGTKYGPRAAVAKDDDALYLVLNEMLGLLKDAHTRATTPEQSADQERQATAGIGMVGKTIDGRWVVTDVARESPAESAGVRPGWILVARNGVPIKERRGGRPREGQRETWDFLDAHDRPLRLSITAQTLSTRPHRDVRVLPSGVVVVRFDRFVPEEQHWLNAVIEAHQSAPGLVLDLRRNRGGRLDVLVPVMGMFFDESVDCGLLFTRGGGRIARETRPCKTAHYSGPMTALIDVSTVSAAEILAAVLQEQKRATLVGRTTRGAVLAGRPYPLPDGGVLQMSGFDYVTPAGRRLEGSGVTPDLETRLTLADVRAGTDPDLQAALRVLSDLHSRR
jgi:carboxyl-terminal processing protease